MTSLLILAVVLAQQPTPPEKATVSGTIVDSVTNQPLGKVSVVARHTTGHEPGASTVTDAAGKFTIIDLDPGQYHLTITRNGYLDTNYGAKKAMDGEGSTITLTAGQKLENLNAKLMPFGVIAGTVRDADGEPLAGASVEIFAVRYEGGRRHVRTVETSVPTDDLGQYREVGLPPGRYYLAARLRAWNEPTVDHSAKAKTPPETPVTTFYPGTIDPSGARAIDLPPGGRATGIDIGLIRSRLYRISLHIDSGAGFRGSAALRYAAEGFGWLGDSRIANSEGNIEIPGVPPGSYILRFGASVLRKTSEGTDDAVPDGCGSRMPLSVKQGDIEGLRLVVGGCAEINVHIIREDGKSLIQNYAAEVGYDDDMGTRTLRPDNTLRLTVSEGRHTVDFSVITNSNGLYLKSMRSGNQDFLRNPITVAPSERLDLEAVLGADGGNVDGVVSDSNSKPVPGARVVLIPNDTALRARADYTPSVTANEAGHFEIKNAAPGDYKLFAWDDIEKDSWFDPDVLKDYEAKGTPVTVKAKTPDQATNPGQTVNLTLIR